MGPALSATIGFGLTIPREFADTVEIPVEYDEDFGEWLNAELTEYHGLKWSNPYFYDSSDEYVVWIHSSVGTFYGAHVHDVDVFEHFANAEEALELYRFAVAHGIDYDDNAGVKIELSMG